MWIPKYHFSKNQFFEPFSGTESKKLNGIFYFLQEKF